MIGHENMSYKCYLFLALLSLLLLFLAEQRLLVLPHLWQLVVNHIVHSLHEFASLVLVRLPVPQRHLVQWHHLQREVWDCFQQIFAKSKCKLSLGCSLHLDHVISFANFGLEDVDYALVLFVNALNVLFCFPLHCVFVSFLVGQSG